MNDSGTEMASSGSRESFGVLILCAGASSRMGSPKALLDWGGKSMLEHVRDVWREAGAAIIAVVFDPRIPAVVGELDRLGISARIPNPDADEGMMSSLRAASSWKGWPPEASRIAVALVDQPGITPALAGSLAEASWLEPGAIWQPAMAGRRGHPVFLPMQEFVTLETCPESSLRDFIRRRESLRRLWECHDSRIFEDLDTPEIYHAAVATRGAARH